MHSRRVTEIETDRKRERQIEMRRVGVIFGLEKIIEEEALDNFSKHDLSRKYMYICYFFSECIHHYL